VEVVEQGMHEIGSRGKACMVCKLFSDCLIGKDAIRSTLVGAWRPERNFSLQDFGGITFFYLNLSIFWKKTE
jgi:hypothetical protein